MPAKKIDGKALAQKTADKVKEEVAELKKKGIEPCLAVVLVGENPASKVYVNMKNIRAKEAGIITKQINLPATVVEEELLEIVAELNKDDKVHGILVQLPLPEQIDENSIIEAISPSKDVDGFTAYNMGKLFRNEEFLVPCTPKGIVKLIESTGTEIKGKNCVVVGRSNIVGKPIGIMMLHRHATVTTCHSKTKNIAEHTRNADILIAAVGMAEFITKDMVKEGAVVVDVGINRTKEGKLTGDVAKDVQEKAAYITPVPGGVGPMTVACLMENTVIAARGRGDGK